MISVQLVAGGNADLGVLSVRWRSTTCDTIGVIQLPGGAPVSPAGGLPPPVTAGPGTPPAATPAGTPPGATPPAATPTTPAAGALPPPPPPAAPGTIALPPLSQCGGSDDKCDAPGAACADSPFPGTACTDGFSCQRQNAYYWQCLPSDAPAATVTAGTSSGGRGVGPADTAQEPGIESQASGSGPSTISDSVEQAEGVQGYPMPPHLLHLSGLHEYHQCGGAGGVCSDFGACEDAPFPHDACEGWLRCQRQSRYYWQCLRASKKEDSIRDWLEMVASMSEEPAVSAQQSDEPKRL
eukprot:gene11244-11393_t